MKIYCRITVGKAVKRLVVSINFLLKDMRYKLSFIPVNRPLAFFKESLEYLFVLGAENTVLETTSFILHIGTTIARLPGGEGRPLKLVEVHIISAYVIKP